MQISLTEKKIRKLLRESRGNTAILRQLCRESIVRIWLKSKGIPSWGNPATPCEQNEITPSARYSIMLSDGSRFSVCTYPDAILSKDSLAAGKCFAALAVELDGNNRSGSVIGCIFLRNSPHSPECFRLTDTGLESISTFLHYLGVSNRYTASLVCFSIRLLFMGEPDAPERGAEGVTAFFPDSSR